MNMKQRFYERKHRSDTASCREKYKAPETLGVFRQHKKPWGANRLKLVANGEPIDEQPGKFTVNNSLDRDG